MMPGVSVVIPTYNEAADIGATLDALMALDEPALEVIVVDASDDPTPEVVGSYPSPPVRLIRHARAGGRTAARNTGVRAALGQIVVVLNADVRLPSDFLGRILPHYAAGADFVLVESRVVNVESATARYVQALHERDYPPGSEAEARMTWTEGFSCRREAALAVGLFPEGAVPMVAGEDGWFGDRLVAAGYRRVFDRTIVVTHVAPADLSGFWHQRCDRGRGWPQVLHLRYGRSLRSIRGTLARVACRRGLDLLLPLGSLWRGWRLSAYSPRRRADWVTFAALDWIASCATLRGIGAGVRELRRAGAR